MVGLGFDEYSAVTTALLGVGTVSVVRVGSQMNLLRCPTRINLSIMNLKLDIDSFHGRDPCGCHTSVTCYIGLGSPAWGEAT